MLATFYVGQPMTKPQNPKIRIALALATLACLCSARADEIHDAVIYGGAEKVKFDGPIPGKTYNLVVGKTNDSFNALSGELTIGQKKYQPTEHISRAGFATISGCSIPAWLPPSPPARRRWT